MEDEIFDQNAEAYNLKRNTVIMMKDRHCIIPQEEIDLFLPDDEKLNIYDVEYTHLYDGFVKRYGNNDAIVLRSSLTQNYEYNTIGAQIMGIPNGGDRRVLVYFIHKKINDTIKGEEINPLIAHIQTQYNQPISRLVLVVNQKVYATAEKAIREAAAEQYNRFSEDEILEFHMSNVYTPKLEALAGSVLEDFHKDFKEITKLPQYGTNDRSVRHYDFPPKTIIRIHRENIILSSLISEYDAFGIVRFEKKL